MVFSRASTILDSVAFFEKQGEPIRVHGGTFSSSAYLAAKLFSQFSKSRKRPLIVLCPSDDLAQEFASALEVLARFATSTPAENMEVHHFPTWEQSAYSPIAPSLRTRNLRIAGLRALNDGRSSIFVTTLAAACQATIPREFFSRASLQLKVGDSIGSRESLTSRLTASGYMRVDPIEDPGTFAVRGEIIDIFPPGAEAPYRIELFGDTIERIRTFDAATQKTHKDGQKEALFIPPAREVLVNVETSSLLRERLKSRADDQGIPRSVRDPLMSMVQDGIYPDHVDAWAPFAYSAPGTLWDHAGECDVLWFDELSCDQAWDSFASAQERLAEDAKTSGTVVPPVAELFRWSAETESLIKSKYSRMYLDRVELATLEELPQLSESAEPEAPQTKHRVFVRSNSELEKGSKSSLGGARNQIQALA